MQSLLQFHFDQLAIFSMVLARVGAAALTAPIFGSRSVPLNCRALIALSLALLVTPLQAHIGFQPPESWVAWLMLLGIEALIGLSLGTGVVILLGALELAGRMIGQVSGLGLAEVVDGEAGQTVPVYGQLMNVIALTVFVAIGGHRMFVAAVLETFQILPPGQGQLPTGLTETLTLLLTESFRLGIRAGAPALAAVLIATLVTGLVSRTLPQINSFSLGFGLNSFASLLAISATLGGMVYLFGGQLEPLMQRLAGMQ